MLVMDCIKPTQNELSCSIILVAKKEGTARYCVYSFWQIENTEEKRQENNIQVALRRMLFSTYAGPMKKASAHFTELLMS